MIIVWSPPKLARRTKEQYGLLRASDLLVPYSPTTFLCSSPAQPLHQRFKKTFLTNILFVVFHPKTWQSHLKMGQIRGSMPRSAPRLLLPPGKKSCKTARVGWAGDTGSWKEPEKRKWDRQKKKHSLAGKSLGRRGGGVPRCQNMQL